MRPILALIVLAQFFCTSLWFAGNSIIVELTNHLPPDPDILAHLTSAIQIGFISGTFVFAIFTISDRYSPSLVFFISAILAGLCNLGLGIHNLQLAELFAFRFFTGFFLAGIYPVGMKIAADHFQASLGKSLGFLVGALVLGTSFSHFVKFSLGDLPWHYVVYTTTLLSVLGGFLIYHFVPDGPYRKVGQGIKLTAFLHGFRNKNFRSVSFGYFGHMWELYAFWAFVPVMLSAYNRHYPTATLSISLWSFVIIAIGALACIFAGILSQRYGEKRIAILALSTSLFCCLVSPLFLFIEPAPVLLIFLLVWSFAVIADSPMFSTLIARHAPQESKGTSLTIVNCIGFSLTIISIECISLLSDFVAITYRYTFLAIGPVFGLVVLVRNKLV